MHTSSLQQLKTHAVLFTLVSLVYPPPPNLNPKLHPIHPIPQESLIFATGCSELANIGQPAIVPNVTEFGVNPNPAALRITNSQFRGNVSLPQGDVEVSVENDNAVPALAVSLPTDDAARFWIGMPVPACKTVRIIVECTKFFGNYAVSGTYPMVRYCGERWGGREERARTMNAICVVQYLSRTRSLSLFLSPSPLRHTGQRRRAREQARLRSELPCRCSDRAQGMRRQLQCESGTKCESFSFSLSLSLSLSPAVLLLLLLLLLQLLLLFLCSCSPPSPSLRCSDAHTTTSFAHRR